MSQVAEERRKARGVKLTRNVVAVVEVKRPLGGTLQEEDRDCLSVVL